MNILGQEDPYAKVGQVNDRTQKATKGEHISALRDINLEVRQGEVLGIIGKNGAGKSTLLKLLSRVTSPTTGTIKVKGRMASLLEVGTGFNPEMTGRENIYMNGTIMGMRKWEITRKLDEIVEFAGVAKYLDTPTKRYSSGMTVRLGFAIAAHLEPEILVVDEVLAVGDAEFQKKAIGKMQEVSTEGGRTVLFVSHNMASVKQLCSACILLTNGSISYRGTTDQVIDEYLKVNEEVISSTLKNRTDRKGNGIAKFTNIQLLSKDQETNQLQVGQSALFIIQIESIKEFNNINVTFSLYNKHGILITSTNTSFVNKEPISINKGLNTIECEFNSLPLQVGGYFVNLGIIAEGTQADLIEKAFSFNMVEDDIYSTGKFNSSSKSLVFLPHKWQVI
ncbi:ABC transporter ATP-binding protein [Natronoflexus pectinivorans]|nr:ABC transporter ATP-binding protein [Natronoflexus pectinivorans]